MTGRPGSRPHETTGENGVVLVWTALSLIVMMAMAAFSVDVGHWYFVRNRLQKTADAAALAAAVYWPALPALATAEANDVARRNGFAGGGAVTVTVSAGPRPTHVRVTIRKRVSNLFGAALGVPETTLSRTAVAEYQGPVPLGSPANTFGDEPLQNGQSRWSNLYSGPTDQPQFWANVFGPRSVKRNGDAHQAKICGGAHACPQAGASPPAGYNTSNTDYRPPGYTYVARVGARPPGATNLAFEVFDPAFVHVDDTCTTNLAGATAHDTGTPNRYAAGTSSPFCTGDQLYSGASGDGVPPLTTYVIRAPDATPWDNLDNPPIVTGACNSNQRQFSGRNADVSGLLSSNPAEPDAGAGVRFADHFRKWFRICRVAASGVPAAGGDYIIQVKTNAPTGSPMASNLNQGGGANRFSMRAAWTNASGVPNSTGVSIFAADAMSIYANAEAADTRFYLARVFPGAGGRLLQLRFFDTGDASAPGDLTVLPPPDSNVGASFSGCLHTREGTGAVNAPTAPGCTIPALSITSDNGDWITVTVPIPDGYSCNSAVPTGCWVRVRFAYGPTTTVQDTTTWSAQMIGDPVRLVE